MLATEVNADSWGRIIDFSADVDGRFGPHGQGITGSMLPVMDAGITWSKLCRSCAYFSMAE